MNNAQRKEAFGGKDAEKIKAIIGKDNYNKVGTYKEAPGGGTPKMSGGGRGAMKGNFEVAHSQEEADEIREENPNAVVRVTQPRDEDGKFTYNSANAKELKYGPSRGTTVPPFLKGYAMNPNLIKKGAIYKVKGEGKTTQYLISTIDMTTEEIVNALRYYLKSEKGFAGLGKSFSESLMVKKGRHSEAEKKADVNSKVGQTDLATKSQSTQNTANKLAADYAAKGTQKETNPYIGSFQAKSDILNPNGSTQKVGDRYSEFLVKNKMKGVGPYPQSTTAPNVFNQPQNQAPQQGQGQAQPQPQAKPQSQPSNRASNNPKVTQQGQGPSQQQIQNDLNSLFSNFMTKSSESDTAISPDKFKNFNKAAIDLSKFPKKGA